MPLWSSNSLRETGSHPNRLEKSPHSRGGSLSGRKASLTRKAPVEEDASTRAVAGSTARLNTLNTMNSSGVDDIPASQPPIGRTLQQSTDATDLRDDAPTPPPHDVPYTGGAMTADNQRDSTHTTSTWHENPAAVRNKHLSDESAHLHDPSGGSSRLPGDLNSHNATIETVRQKLQIAVDAELAADKALDIARRAVVEARTVVGAFEHQVNQEFERAYARKVDAAGVVKDLEKLGRYNN